MHMHRILHGMLVEIIKMENRQGGQVIFDTDNDFRIAEYMHFCNRLLKERSRKKKVKAPAMIVFCSFQQMPMVIELWKKAWFRKFISLFFVKKSSGQALKQI